MKEKKSKIILLILGISSSLLLFIFLNLVPGIIQAVESLESVKAKAQETYNSINAELNTQLDKTNNKYAFIPAGAEIFSFPELTGIAGINVTPTLNYDKLIKSSFTNKITAAKNNLDIWLAAVNAAVTVDQAKIEYNRLKNELKIREIILPGLKTAEDINKFYNGFNGLNIEYNKIRNNIIFFNGRGYFDPNLNFKYINPKYIKTATSTASSLYQQVSSNQGTLTDYLFSNTFFENIFNIAEPNSTKILTLKNKIKGISADLLNGEKIYNRSLGSIKELYIKAAKEAMVPTALTSANGLDYMRPEYEKLYNKYQAEVGNFCYRINQIVNGELKNVIAYKNRVKNLNLSDFDLDADLEVMRLWRENYIRDQQGLLNCTTASYATVEDVKRNTDIQYDDFVARFNIAEKFNLDCVKKLSSLKNFVNRFEDSFDEVRAISVFNSSERSSLDFLRNKLKPGGILLTDTLNGCINDAPSGLKQKILDFNTPINDLENKSKDCTAQFRTLQTEVNNAKSKWYDLLNLAAQRGGNIPIDLQTDVRAAQSFREFREKRENYYQKADLIIDLRKEKISYYKDKLVAKFAELNPANVGAANYTLLQNAYDRIIADVNEMIVDSDGVAPADGGILEVKRAEIKATTDYFSLVDSVKSIKDLDIYSVLIPSQREWLKAAYYYQKYYLLQLVTDSLAANIDALDISNPAKTSLAASAATILEGLGNLDSHIDLITDMLTDPGITPGQFKEIGEIKQEIQREISSLDLQIKELTEKYEQALE